MAAAEDVEFVMHHFETAVTAYRNAGLAPFGGVEPVVGTRVMNLRARETVGAFEEGEVIAVDRRDDGNVVIEVQVCELIKFVSLRDWFT